MHPDHMFRILEAELAGDPNLHRETAFARQDFVVELDPSDFVSGQ
jgi:hypothetical protein